jgi:hypothetical protein
MLSRRSLDELLVNEPESILGNGNLHCMTITNGQMVKYFPAIVALATEQGYKALVISSFELAAHSVRHRELLATQINQLRIDQGMAILVFTKEKMARIGKKQEFLTGAIGLLLSFSEPAIGLGPDDDLALEEPEYMKLCRAREEELKANPPPIPPANLISYEDFAGVPIEQVLPESDWDNPLYTNIPKMAALIAELRLKKEKNLLRMDTLKNREYGENREEFMAKMEELLGEPSKC